MANPYDILNVTPEDGDDAIRKRYLEAVRRFPPETHPEQFQRVRDAYERIKDADSRLAFLLFEPSQGETIEELIEEEQCRNGWKPPGLKTLLNLANSLR